MDFAPLVEQKRRTIQELETEIATPSLFENPKRAREVMREHSQIKRLLDDWAALKKSEKELEENRELSASSDSDLAELQLPNSSLGKASRRVGENGAICSSAARTARRSGRNHGDSRRSRR